jgi:hypothetical protein
MPHQFYRGTGCAELPILCVAFFHLEHLSLTKTAMTFNPFLVRPTCISTRREPCGLSSNGQFLPFLVKVERQFGKGFQRPKDFSLLALFIFLHHLCLTFSVREDLRKGPDTHPSTL